MASSVIPFSLKDAPALIERLLPVQKLSAEVFRKGRQALGKRSYRLGPTGRGASP